MDRYFQKKEGFSMYKRVLCAVLLALSAGMSLQGMERLTRWGSGYLNRLWKSAEELITRKNEKEERRAGLIEQYKEKLVKLQTKNELPSTEQMQKRIERLKKINNDLNRLYDDMLDDLYSNKVKSSQFSSYLDDLNPLYSFRNALEYQFNSKTRKTEEQKKLNEELKRIESDFVKDINELEGAQQSVEKQQKILGKKYENIIEDVIKTVERQDREYQENQKRIAQEKQIKELKRVLLNVKNDLDFFKKLDINKESILMYDTDLTQIKKLKKNLQDVRNNFDIISITGLQKYYDPRNISQDMAFLDNLYRKIESLKTGKAIEESVETGEESGEEGEELFPYEKEKEKD